ncbi:hypothetical protein DYH09_06950 [bacterium CPR1]|nr:hypothetical protein [bacterium CPR1]
MEAAEPPRVEPVSTRLIGHGVAQAPGPAGPADPRLPPIKASVRVGGDEPPPPPEPEAEPEPPAWQTMVAAPTAPVEPPPPPPPPIDEQILEEARRKAQQIITDAQEQAARFKEEAQALVKEAEKTAREQGFEQGKGEGLEAGKQQLAGVVEEFKVLFRQFVSERERVLKAAEPELARLSVKIAERVLGLEIKCNPEVIVGVVRDALSGIKDREEITIRCHPDDFEQARKHQPEFEKMVEGLKKFEVQADASLDPGSCVLETNLGNVDARLATKMAAIAAAFEETAELVEAELSSGN